MGLENSVRDSGVGQGCGGAQRGAWGHIYRTVRSFGFIIMGSRSVTAAHRFLRGSWQLLRESIERGRRPGPLVKQLSERKGPAWTRAVADGMERTDGLRAEWAA